ncbi:unnamed protein product [Dicrocoelium dendriticum]|nr:unnamed protein product [Dicrocoelium dendriticum]
MDDAARVPNGRIAHVITKGYRKHHLGVGPSITRSTNRHLFVTSFIPEQAESVESTMLYILCCVLGGEGATLGQPVGGGGGGGRGGSGGGLLRGLGCRKWGGGD